MAGGAEMSAHCTHSAPGGGSAGAHLALQRARGQQARNGGAGAPREVGDVGWKHFEG